MALFFSLIILVPSIDLHISIHQSIANTFLIYYIVTQKEIFTLTWFIKKREKTVEGQAALYTLTVFDKNKID